MVAKSEIILDLPCLDNIHTQQSRRAYEGQSQLMEKEQYSSQQHNETRMKILVFKT